MFRHSPEYHIAEEVAARVSNALQWNVQFEYIERLRVIHYRAIGKQGTATLPKDVHNATHSPEEIAELVALNMRESEAKRTATV